MTISTSTVWRIRISGNNANGGGYDPAVSGTLATTTTGSLSSGATSVTVASATGWPASGSYYACINSSLVEPSGGGSEIVLVTAGAGTTTWTITRAQLGTTALAFASGVNVTNALNRCDTAALTGTAGTSTASTTFTDAGATFNETCVGNTIWIASGTGATVGVYTIQSFSSAHTVVLDRASGTYTAGVWKMGGAWADPRTNAAALVPGNSMFIRGSGSGSKASPDYTIGAISDTLPNGDATNGRIWLIGENGALATNDRPVLKLSGTAAILQAKNEITISELYFISDGTHTDPNVISGRVSAFNYTFDQNGIDTWGFNIDHGILVGVEVFSSVANSGSAGSGFGISTTGDCLLLGCTVHNCWGNGIRINLLSSAEECIIAKNRGDGVQINGSNPFDGVSTFVRCTIDNNHGNGFYIPTAGELDAVSITSCIISNHTTASTYGIKMGGGTTAANDRIRGYIDYNTYYNNGTNALNLTVGTSMLSTGIQLHDTLTGTDPYVNESSNDYTPVSGLSGDAIPISFTFSS